MALDEQSVTRMLSDFGSGDRSAVSALLPMVYDELRRLAAVHFAEERQSHTLQPTALVHEAFLRLADQSNLQITSRSHFFRLASKVMRQILIDHARARQAERRGGGAEQYPLEVASAALESETTGASPIDLLAVEDALERLSALNASKARLVELRFFGGLSNEEAADALGISRAQVAREWRTTRAWLAQELNLGGDA